MSLRALNRVSKRRLVTVRVARFSVAAIIAFSGLIGVQKFTMAAEGDLSYDRTIALVPTACSSGSDFDSAGNIYVIDWCEHKVYKFTSSGTPILDWGGNGSAAGEFSNPQDILVGSDDRIYITDYSNARVQIFDTNGVYIDEYGSYGTGLGQFQGPNYIAEAPDGTLYVSESSTHTIEQFSKSGTPINEFGSFGTAEGQFRSPGGLAFGPDDNLYVGDWNNKRVQVFTASGAFIRAFGVPVNANGPGAFWDITGIDFDDDGRLYVGDGTQGRIQVFDSGGAYAGDFGSQGTGSGQFDYLTNLTIHNGEVYASDSTARLQVIDIDKEDPYVRAASVDLFSAGYGPEGWNGNGYTMTEQAFPTKVQLPDGVTPEKVEVGQGYSAVIGSDDKLYVFGQNVDGQLGQGNTTNQTTPVEFPLPGGATAVDVEISALTYNIFVLASDGQVYGAGNNTDGRLGAGLGSLTSDVPVRFQLPVGVDAQSVHYDEFLNPYVITTDGDVYTAGTGNRGQLGNGLFANQSTPVKVDLPVGVTATGKIVSYEGYTALLASDGNAYAFGQNTDGQLGIGTNIDTATPTAIPLPGGVTATDIVASHDQYNIFIRTSDDQLYGTGTNGFGQLGDGTTDNSNTAVLFQLPGGLDVKELTDEWGATTCVIATDDRLYCAGKNIDGQLGLGDYATHSTPTKYPIPGDPAVEKAIHNWQNVYVLTSTGQIWVTGNNSYAQTGAGTGAGDAITPTQIPMPSGVTPEDIMTNPDPRTRLTIMGDDGNVWSIGSGRIGKLGTGSIEPIQPTVSRYLLPKYAEALSMHMNYNLDQSTGNESTQVIARTSAINAFGTIVFNDADDDGLQDAGEPGVNGEIVRLYEDTDNDGLPDGSVLETVTTANYMGRDGVALFDALPEGGYVLRLTIDGTDSYRSVILDSNEGGWFSDPTNLLIATSSFPVVNGSPSTDPPTTPPTPTAPNVDTPGAPSTGFRKIESLIWWSIVALCAALTLAVSIRKLSRK